jgi:ATP-dependent helicase/nuclease subunit A
MALRHTMISASAGSGKTYQLVRRYLHLMVCGVSAEKIAAMTFTRKASGEFFNRILNRLSELADGTIQPEHFFAGMSPLPAQWPDFSQLLRHTTQSMQKLRLGTLDSFFATVCSCFPLELGLPLGASVTPEEDEAAARDETMQSLVERIFRERDEAAAQALVEAFKEATYGSQEKSMARSLSDWIKRGHALLLESRPEVHWGKPQVIWPQRSAAIHGDWPRLSELPAQLNEAVRAQIQGKAEDWWEELMQELATHEPGMKLKTRVKDMVTKVAAVEAELRQGTAEITMNRAKTELTGAAAKAMLDAAQALLAYELLVRCKRTEGVAHVLVRYEQEYAAAVRGAGRLSFADVQRLLGLAAQDWLAEADGADLWYRLDSRYQHWLFDEFQDTSFMQWRVVRGLLDEVLQSIDGDRSFFAVGDLKQSIYLWRNAEPGLFDMIRHEHPAEEQRGIVEEKLSKSFRSAPQVLDMVNHVFSDHALLTQALGGATRQWSFQSHVAAHLDKQGYAAMLWPAEVGEGEEEVEAEHVLLALLREIKPTARGLSCAVLVRDNKEGVRLAELIRSETGMEVVCESKETPITDNAVTLALLSILQLAAHPGDSFAVEHLRMTPLLGITTPHELAQSTQRMVLEEGFLGWVKHWSTRLHELMPLMDAFTQHRLEQLADVAAEMDSTGSRDLDDFIKTARAHTLRTRGASNAIQVMTIHASKGLEFDVVLLPDLDGRSMDEVKTRDLVAPRTDEGDLSWVLQPPVKAFVEMDEVLKAEHEVAQQRNGFESLCRLYVAMTRAETALYLIADPLGSGSSMNEAKLLRTMLGLPTAKPKSNKAKKEFQLVSPEPLRGLEVHWASEIGDRHWYAPLVETTAPAPAPVIASTPVGTLLRHHQPLARRRTPSGEESFKMKGHAIFSENRDTGRLVGSLVHEMLSHVRWVDELYDEAEQIQTWEQLRFPTHAAYDKALPHAKRAIASGAFYPPRGEVKLWRERPFDLVLPNHEWITGTFDRVVVTADGAQIIDFKTDDVSAPNALVEKVAGYKPQLALYRQAVSRLTGFPLDKITATLVFTRREQDACVPVDLDAA